MLRLWVWCSVVSVPFVWCRYAQLCESMQQDQFIIDKMCTRYVGGKLKRYIIITPQAVFEKHRVDASKFLGESEVCLFAINVLSQQPAWRLPGIPGHIPLHILPYTRKNTSHTRAHSMEYTSLDARTTSVHSTGEGRQGCRPHG